MLTRLRRILSFEMTIAEWIGTAAMLATPYLAVGMLWSLLGGGGWQAVVWWPALLVSAGCVT
jgi:hypothetical protein